MMTIGLVGCGKWGANILRDLVSLGCEVQVVDFAPGARAYALQHGAAGAHDALESLPPCQGFVVAVPIPDLAPVCAQLIPHGRPIFAEKTLCTSMEAVADLEARGGRDLIYAMHKWHYHPGIEALRRIAAEGALGRLQGVQTTRHAWVPDFHGGDVFWTLAIHDLTILEHILGDVPSQIRALDVILDASGLAVGLTALLGSGPAVLMSVHGRHWNNQVSVSLQGTHGTAGLRDAYADHVVLRDAHGERRVPIDTTFPLLLELREFITHLQGGPRPRCGLSQAGAHTQRLLDLRKAAGLSSQGSS
jgi:predicted dehydrogenase